VETLKLLLTHERGKGGREMTSAISNSFDLSLFNTTLMWLFTSTMAVVSVTVSVIEKAFSKFYENWRFWFARYHMTLYKDLFTLFMAYNK
jgi:hypothetical protein